MSDLLQALQTPRRREILRLIWEEELAAGEIHRAMRDSVTFGAVSQHLRKLEAAGAVSCRRDGRTRYYQACPEVLGALRPWLESMWDSALYELKLQAELDAARRGPTSHMDDKKKPPTKKSQINKQARKPTKKRAKNKTATKKKRTKG